MFRKLVLTSAVSLALSSGVVGALGLGAIRAQTALNEPFAGEIELLDAEADELDAVKASLAGPEDFKKAGTGRPHFLSKLSFRPQVSPQGRTIIRVSSPEPVREPFLDFLVEVTWPKGRLVKEYTVLLDPPVTVNRPPPQVERPAVAARPAPRPESRREPPPARASAPNPAMPAAAEGPVFPLRSGPIKPGAGLWRIARALAPRGATVPQTAMALYRNNQDAFIRGDIDKVKLGSVLEIATAAELFALDPEAADREFKAAVRGERATATPLTDVTAAAASDARLKIAGAAQPTAVPPPAAVPTETAEAAPALGAIKQELLLVQEAGESTRQETAELHGRIRDLEVQLQDIRKLLSLRNEQLAQLQAEKPEVTQTVPPEATGVEPLAAGTETAHETQAGPAGPGVVEPAGEMPAGEMPAAVTAPPVEAVPVASTTEKTARPEPEPAPKPSFWDTVPLSAVALASGALLLLPLLGWVVMSRRKRLEESLVGATLVEDRLQPAAGAAAPGESQATSQIPSSYSGFSHLEDETEEGDIISEADVYIAYGRYREAESLLGEEIARTPERFDLKFKLAEAYFGAKNRAGLAGLMDEMRQAGADRAVPDQWQRLTGMARDLEGTATAPAPRAVPTPGRAQRPTPLSPPSTIMPKSTAAADGTGFELSLPRSGREDASGALLAFPLSGPAQGRSSQDLYLDVEDLDLIGKSLDLGAGDKRSADTGASDLELRLDDLDQLGSIDFDSFVAPERKVGGEKPAPVPRVDEGSLDSAPAARIAERSQDVASVGKSSFAGDVLSSQWQMDSGLWDEVATKIDLALAYMGMEDPDAARVILQEVVEEGNEAQRAEAREMLTRLD